MGRAYRSRERTHNRRERSAASRTGRAGPRLTVVAPVAMTRLDQGAVVWAHVPYVDGTGEKTRPAVVCSRSGREVVLLPVTITRSRFRHPDRYVEILDLEDAGITRESAVALQAVPVDRIDVLDITGHLSPVDAIRVFGSGHVATSSDDRFARVG